MRRRHPIVVMCLLCLAAEPGQLHRGEPTRPVPAADARALVQSLAEPEVVDNPAQLDALLRRPDQPDPVALTWRAGVAPLLGPAGALGQQIQTAGIQHIQTGPEYTLVILGTEPMIGVRVREDASGRFIDQIRPTSCLLCPEEVRFVRDLLVDVQTHGRDAHRLLPNVELDLSGWSRASGQRSGAMQTRNGAGEWLPSLLDGASVIGTEGSLVDIQLGDGTVDRWTVKWSDGRWMVDYAALPEDSPLRLESAELDLWRRSKRARAATLQTWTPRFVQTPDGAGLQLAHRAVDALVDVRTGTVWVLLLDLDRLLAGLARIDPDSGTVLERHPLPISDAAPLEPEGWVSRWSLAADPTGAWLAISTPSRLFRFEVATGRVELIDRTKRLSAMSWTSSGLTTVERSGPIEIRRLDGTMSWSVAGPDARWAETHTDGTWVLEGDGTLAVASGGTRTAVNEVCCGAVVDACRAPGSAHLLATCTPECDHAAAVVPLGDAAVRRVLGVGGLSRAASWSPDDRWWTTSAASGDILLWERAGDRVVAAIDDGPWMGVRWLPDSSGFLTVSAAGEVWLWDLATVRQQRGLP